jgi:hypothetical protein
MTYVAQALLPVLSIPPGGNKHRQECLCHIVKIMNTEWKGKQPQFDPVFQPCKPRVAVLS